MNGAELDVLIPTYERPGALAVTLAALASQSIDRFRVLVSDQSESRPVIDAAEVSASAAYLDARGNRFEYVRHLPRRGLAEHRQFLLNNVRRRYCLFLDDDVICEPDLAERLLRAIAREGCGFVGSALIGLSYRSDVRPQDQQIELWDGPVEPEQVRPGSSEWERASLHDAANLWHVQERLEIPREEAKLYKVAWVGGCVLYDAEKLRAAGGFDFWRRLPAEHVGEDVFAEMRVMERFGGAGLIPSGAYHQELPTTLPVRDLDAPRALSLH
jgi:GT2 family glycosyltransferase